VNPLAERGDGKEGCLGYVRRRSHRTRPRERGSVHDTTNAGYAEPGRNDARWG
jgi:hypothetical protein